ncbi:MAG: PHP domain-containing protein [Chlamydiales bacterium]
MIFKADLHCHSIFSDGTDDPEKLIYQAVQSGLLGLSITDHDTIAAYPAAIDYARKHRLLLLPGVEFSAAYQGVSVHVLGYAFALHSQKLHQLCDQHRHRRVNRNRNILKKLKKLGMSIEEEEIKTQSKVIGRPHIAQIMVQKGFVSSIKEAFDHYLGEKKEAYDPGEPISIMETIETIHAAYGLAVIAHPHLIKQQSIIKYLLELPFDGIEAYYARFKPAQEKPWIEIGNEKKWINTGGSDYHGKIKPFHFLGSSWVDKNTFDQLYAHYLISNS